MNPFVTAVLSASLLCGCGSTPLYQVSSEDNQGVPFYVQEQFDVRIYTYEEVFYEIKATGTFKPDTGQPDSAHKPHVGPPEPPPNKKPDQSPKKDEDASIVRTVVAFARDFSVAAPYYVNFLQDTDNVQAWKDTGKTLLDDVANAANKDRLQLAPFPPRTLSVVASPDSPPRDPGIRLVAVDRTRIQIPSATQRF